MSVTCDRCGHHHEVPRGRIPRFGARIRCGACGHLFPVGGAHPAPALEREVRANGADIDLAARRLARGLLTDMVYADPDRYAAACRQGRVLAAYAGEIGRAWSFYQRRVGERFAVTTTHFRDALRQILGAGPSRRG